MPAGVGPPFPGCYAARRPVAEPNEPVPTHPRGVWSRRVRHGWRAVVSEDAIAGKAQPREGRCPRCGEPAYRRFRTVLLDGVRTPVDPQWVCARGHVSRSPADDGTIETAGVVDPSRRARTSPSDRAGGSNERA